MCLTVVSISLYYFHDGANYWIYSHILCIYHAYIHVHIIIYLQLKTSIVKSKVSKSELGSFCVLFLEFFSIINKLDILYALFLDFSFWILIMTEIVAFHHIGKLVVLRQWTVVTLSNFLVPVTFSNNVLSHFVMPATLRDKL